MKVFQIVKTVFLSILMLIFFMFAIAMTLLLLNFNKFGVTEFGETSLIIINGNISSEKYEKGDLVLVEKRTISNLNKGDEIFAYNIDGQTGTANVEVGKVGQVHKEDFAVSFENGNTFDIEYVIGSSSKVYKNVGTFLSIIESKWGFLFIILVPSFLIFVYQVYALIVEIKYGSEE